MRRLLALCGVARDVALRMATPLALAVGGCSTAAAPAADAGSSAADAAARSPDARPAAADDAGPEEPEPDAAPRDPYRHTIEVDGQSSFTSDEVFPTTTESYSAYATWDDERLYFGYLGSDVAAGDASKWLLVYLDVEPGGSPSGQRYNTQTPSFPEGFRADYYYRWQSSGGIEGVVRWTGGAWQDAPAVAASSARGGSLIEVSLPLADLGDPAEIGVAVLWINETDGLEAAYGGLYADSFADGYHAAIPIARYLDIDRASPLPPNDAGNQRP